MEISKHNPYCRLIGKTIGQGNVFVELIYGETNEGADRGLEVYYYDPSKQKSMPGYTHFHYSRRWQWDKIPSKYQDEALKLSQMVHECPAGHKLYCDDHKLLAA